MTIITKYRFTEKDNIIAETEMTIAGLLDRNGGRVETPEVQFLITQLGRRIGGDHTLNVRKNVDGTHNVWID